VSDVLTQIRQAEISLAEMRLEARLKENLSFMERVAPELAERFAAYRPERFRLHYADSGYVELVDSAADNRPVYPRDPVEHTREQLERFFAEPRAFQCDNMPANVLDEETNAHVSNSNRIVAMLAEHPAESPGRLPDFVNFMMVLGVGLGHHLEGLLTACDVRNLCLIEPEADLFHACLHTVDWPAVVSRFTRPGYSLELIVAEGREACAEQLEAYLTEIGGFNVVHPFLYEHYGSEELKQAFDDFANRVMPAQISALGYFDDERVGLAHSVANYDRGIPILRAPHESSSEGAAVPAFLVANGPSLDGAVDFIREHRDRAVVFSCGTALGSLARAGIKPDFHVEMERSRPVVEWIENSTTAEEREGVTLLALNTVHPEVFDLFGRRGMAMKAADVGARYLAGCFAPDARVADFGDCNPTVANAALAHVAALGFHEVYLFGLDLGFPAGDRHHSALSTHYDVLESDAHALGVYRRDGGHNRPAPGNFGDEIVTTPVYLAARAALERVLGTHPALRCHNASAGLRIGGAEPVRLGEIVLDSAPVTPPERAAELFERYYHRDGLTAGRRPGIEEVVEGLRVGIERLRSAAARPVPSKREGLSRLAELHAVVRELESEPGRGTSAALLRGSVAIFSVLLSQALHRFRDEARAVALYARSLERFGDFLEGAEAIGETSLLATDRRTRKLGDLLNGAQSSSQA
jgi:hypothetical protein